MFYLVAVVAAAYTLFGIIAATFGTGPRDTLRIKILTLELLSVKYVLVLILLAAIGYGP